MRTLIACCVLLEVFCQGNHLASNKLALLLRDLLDDNDLDFRQATSSATQTTTPAGQTSSTTLATVAPTLPPGSPDFDEKEFNDLEKMFRFPDSNFLMDLLYQYCMTDMTFRIGDIVENFEIPQCDVEDLAKHMIKLHRDIPDAESVAALLSRLLTKAVFWQRMRCPTNIIDHALSKAMIAQRDVIMDGYHADIMNFFLEEIPSIDANLKPYAKDLAHVMALKLQQTVFNDTMIFVMAFGIRDVALASHLIYHSVTNFFKNIYTTLDPEHGLVRSVYLGMWNLSCPSYPVAAENHRKIVWKFIEEFEVLEVGDVCSLVYDLLLDYGTSVIPNYQAPYQQQELLPVCNLIHNWLHDILVTFRDYEKNLYEMDLGLLQNLVRDVLQGYEWQLVEEAARRIGFGYNNY